MEAKPDVYCIQRRFLVFNKEHALMLRSRRIIGQLVGCSPTSPHQLNDSGLPYLLSHYSARLALERKLVNFKKLEQRKDQTAEDNEARYKTKLGKLIDQCRQLFEKKRAEELQSRNIELTPDRLAGFNETKLRVTVLDSPDNELCFMNPIPMDDDEVRANLSVDSVKTQLYDNLYDLGLYVSSGFKFGCDFLAYEGDPVRYHAKYAIRTVASRQDGYVDLTRISYNLVNTLNRLCYSSNKIPLLVTANNQQLKYWLLREKVYLLPNSRSEDLIPFDKRSLSRGITNPLSSSHKRDYEDDNEKVKRNNC